MSGTGSDFCRIGSNGMDQSLISKNVQNRGCKKTQLSFFASPFFCLLAFGKASAAGLVTFAGTCPCDRDLICFAFLVVVESTLSCLTVYLDGLTSAACIHCILHTFFAFHETIAAGFIHRLCSGTAYLDISLGTILIFIIHTCSCSTI